jgi:uncharacterized protein YecE (DUF72 family)
MPDLFGDEPPHQAPPVQRKKPTASTVTAAALDPTHQALAAQLPLGLRLGTSSWHFPGWASLVWDDAYAQEALSKHGLPAYAQHPLLRTVSLDRAFYRPMTVAQYAALAVQVPDDFRFVVKVPSALSDALVRSTEGDDAGKGLQANPHFLNAELMRTACVEPVAQGLGHKLGALVLQISPLPAQWLQPDLTLFDALTQVLSAQAAIKNVVPDAIIAVEVRNPELLATPMREALVRTLHAAGATYCLSLHSKMPPIEEQLPILRALWPGPLVCRWNLHRKHGRFGYQAAKDLYEPFSQLVDGDLQTRATLAKVIQGTTAAGYPALVTIGNKAEGSAPLSVVQLARSLSQ